MWYNASLQILEPERTYSATTAAAVTVAEDAQTAIRCRMSPMRASQTVNVLGDLGPRLYECRFVSSMQIAERWRLRVTLDSESAAYDYTVRHAVKNLLGHWHVTAERV